jgi:thioredoxin 1
MKNILPLAILALCAAVLSSPAPALADPEHVIVGTDTNFKKQVLGSKVPVLVDFWAPWCGPCRYYGPMVERAAERHKGKLRVVKVNIDENEGLAQSYSIRSIPLTLFFHEGKLVKKFSGAPRHEGTFQSMVDEFVKGGPK